MLQMCFFSYIHTWQNSKCWRKQVNWNKASNSKGVMFWVTASSTVYLTYLDSFFPNQHKATRYCGYFLILRGCLEPRILFSFLYLTPDLSSWNWFSAVFPCGTTILYGCSGLFLGSSHPLGYKLDAQVLLLPLVSMRFLFLFNWAPRPSPVNLGC